MFQIKVVEKIKVHILCGVKEATNDDILARCAGLTWLDTSKQTPTPVQPNSHAEAHKRSCTHTEICDAYCFSTAAMVL
jgi:hypothetical protein